MPVETRGQKRRRLEKEKRKREDGVIWIENFPYEVIEKIARHLEPNDVLELMMVNKRLHSSYARDQSIVFGDHVDEIWLSADSALITKHPGLRRFKLDFDRHLHLIKRVTSCDKLAIWIFGRSNNEAHKTILKQLESVNRLQWLVDSVAWLTKLCPHFHASVNEIAKVRIRLKSFEKDESVNDFGNFIGKQLTDCENIELDVTSMSGCGSIDELTHVCYQALKKTRVKMISMCVDNLFSTVQWIVKHGIPSKKPEANFYVWIDYSLVEMDEIISLLTKYPGMEEIEGENCVSLLEQAKNLWKNENIFEENWDMEFFCFRQKIELNKDCIHVLCGPGAVYDDEEARAAYYAFHISSTST